MPEDERALISKEDALAIAKQAMEAARTGRADAIASVNAALKPRGLRYANSNLSSQTAEYMADDIVHFARPLSQR